MIDLRPSPDQQQVVDSVAGYLARAFPVERHQPGKTSSATERSAWRELAAQGFFGLAAPEEIGGAGFTIVEDMLAQREFGRALLSPGVMAAGLAAHLAHAGGLGKTAADIVSGERGVAVASTAELRAGSEIYLFDSAPADLVLILTDHGPALIERETLGELEQLSGTDETLTLHRAIAPATPPLVLAPELRSQCTLMLAAALLGMAEAARDMAVAHAGVREQFGKLIGSFQAVAHHCADMELRARAARAQTAFAAIALTDGRPDAAFHVSAAAVVAIDAALRNCTMAIRVLGAMGFTAECALHLYLKRSHLHERLAGGIRTQRQDVMRHDAAAILTQS